MVKVYNIQVSLAGSEHFKSTKNFAGNIGGFSSHQGGTHSIPMGAR